MYRFFDILLSFIGIIIFAPLFMVIACWVKIDSDGPVFYRQVRVGKGGIDFQLIKFRSMFIRSDLTKMLTIGVNDPRITRAGFVLRKYKLDELPQLFNVLVGEMSLVGPRPEVRKYVDLYNEEQLSVLGIKPGITDYASVAFSNENELLSKVENPEDYYIKVVMPEKLRLNIKYIRSRSVRQYFRIIFLTILRII
jgi:lipopolysaccharide/colanic/teichoic acid biosynthesis glycosyltransferase